MKKGLRIFAKMDDTTPFLEVEARPFDLGEFRVMKRDFGLEHVGALDFSNPDHIVGAAFVLGRALNPNLTVEAIEACVRIEIVNEDEDAAGTDPTPSPSPAEDSSASSTAQGESGEQAASS